MAHFARVDENYIVQEVLVITQEELNLGYWGDPAMWYQTSYNTRGGIYYIPNTDTPDPDQSKAYRKNYAGSGFSYNPERDAFIPPQPYSDWVLDDFSCLWEAPVPYPDDGKEYYWDETIHNWVLIPDPPAETGYFWDKTTNQWTPIVIPAE